MSAHRLALERAPDIGFGRYVVSATTPFAPADLEELRRDAPAVVRRLHPDYEAVYGERGWRMFPGIERVYVNERARAELGWSPRYDFARPRGAAGGRGPPQPARPRRRREGLPPRHDRPVHPALTR
ncbi:MAG TPA: hypothetical protein VHK23_07735 [Miltoncostaeaceae bacterium]|nr:hypothetical protein [Miltoncostaeaceae bacterium]